MNGNFDVVVVGGGLVGAAFACLLAAAPNGSRLRIAVLDARRPEPLDPVRDATDLRVSAVSKCSRQILGLTGAWDGLHKERLAPYRSMRVWDAGGRVDDTNTLCFDAVDIGEPDLGYIVENRHIQTALVDRMESLSNIEYFAPVSLSDLILEDRHAKATLDSGDTLTAKLVVGADGARSKSRELAGIAVTAKDYEQNAVVTHVTSERGHGDTAWQRFLPSGPLALLPLYDGRSSVVWSTGTDRAAELMQLSDPDLSREITVHSDGVLGELVVSAPRGSFPLRLQHAAQYCRRRFVLIGDAAHAVHPLAGQGVNLGFLDAATLAEVLDDAIGRHAEIGDFKVLRRYERWRKSENLVAMRAFDGLQQIFGTAQKEWSRIRRTGMGMVNRMTPVKTALIRRAMGIAGDLPRCVREFGV